ncbi:periplasmic heavy metal sensor [Maribellus comscasis]|uniref:Periplasmic heavy metal sensor n=1 Tax=Maribellus comscasis TaxID=2681766 RepID=A0A6I6JPK8_9BACT|nr:hypothetical protein [Maribellus comscasis]QGY44391.1 periplasmic heavy metal sensor [Maribellus comscasis]
MAKSNKYRILIWAIVILLATNISMGFSFLYHKMQDKKAMEQTEEVAIEIPAERRTRFFREQLDLRFDQMDTFRELNRNFNQKAWQINHDLETLRHEMVEEMGKESPVQTKLDSISTQIGELHTKLKKETIAYYLAMKNECDEQQREKLNEIFMSVLQKNEDVKLPKYGRNRLNRR